MGINFPSSPTVGDLYPVPIVPGVPQYQWNGTAWLASSTGVGPSPDDSVRYDTSQSLTDAQTLQARQNIYAAPFDAMAYSGMQINGSMDVSQEFGTTSRSTPGYVLDGWLFQKGAGITPPMSSAQADATGVFPGLFQKCVYVNNSSTQASIPAGDYVFIQHVIEGYRIARLNWGTVNAKPITIGFWTAHVAVGTYSISIRNASPPRSYVATYTQNVSSTPEYKTITIPGDVTGTWATDNTLGMNLSFAMASGSTLTVPSPNTWLAGGYIAAPGQINGIGSVNVLRITGVVVLPGTQAPTAAQSPLLMRPYDQELLTCQRYYYKTTCSSSNVYRYGTATGFPADAGTISFPTTMRAAPTTSVVTAPGYTNCSGITVYADPTGAVLGITVTANGFYQASGGTYSFDARL